MENTIGHGIDLVEVEDIQRQIDSFEEQFLSRCYTRKEIEASSKAPNRHQYYAGRFAAKEATMKALGYFLGDGISYLDIEIIRAKSGSPEVVLHGKAENYAKEKGIHSWMLSISHSKKTAIASAIALGEGS